MGGMGDDFLCFKVAVDIEPFDGELVWQLPTTGETSPELLCNPEPAAESLPPPLKKPRVMEACEGTADLATSTTATLATGERHMHQVRLL